MDVKRKVGVLPDAGLSANQKVQAPSAAVDVSDTTKSKKVDKEGAGLQLWKEWATQTLGPLASEPTHEELYKSKQKLRVLEKKCADLSARAQRRLAVSAAIRGLSPTPTQHGNGDAFTTPGAPGNQASTAFSRQAMWSAREQRRTAAYDAAREAGVAERTSTSVSLSGNSIWAMNPPSVGSLKSHTMLKDILAAKKAPQNVVHAAAHDSSKRYSRLSSASSLPGDAAALGAMRASPSGAQVGSVLRIGFQDARVSPSVRLQAGTPSISGDHTRSKGKHNSHEHAGIVLALQQEIDSLRNQLDEAQHTVEAKAEMEAQLREALDVLRARCAAQGARELDHQRRLQQHERLQPIFDRLAECFVFRTPEEVVERLEFLEDEQLGNFGELQRAQEEVATLQQQLTAALERIEVVRTQETSQQLAAVNKLQNRNNDLQGELEQLNNLNRKLEARQQQLVQLQGAVIDLWGCCQKDPAFIEANSEGTSQQGASKPRQSSSGEVEGGDRHKDGHETSKEPVGAASGDLQVILGLIKELLMAKNPAQASMHYQSMQQVAHRVWAQHFTHKRSLRGKILETFEALSNLAEIMAAKIRSVNDQLSRSKETQAALEDDLERLQVQKRSLQVALERRDQLVRDMSGVPRSKRPDSAAAYQQVLMQDNVSWGPQARTVLRSSTLTSTSSSKRTSPYGYKPRPQSARVQSLASPDPAAQQPSVTPVARGTLAGIQQAAAAGHKSGTDRTAYRPVSAPVSRPAQAPNGQPAGYAEPLAVQQPPAITPYAQHLQQHAPQYHHVADVPDGMHWNTFAKQAAAGSRPQSAQRPGALFGRSSSSGMYGQLLTSQGTPSTAHIAALSRLIGTVQGVQGPNQMYDTAVVDGVAAQVVDTQTVTLAAGDRADRGVEHGEQHQVACWRPPNRSEIEAKFLSRLERAATSRAMPVC